MCVWDLHEGRRTIAHSLHTGSVGFCQCGLLEADGNKTLLALPAENMEEVSMKSTLCTENFLAFVYKDVIKRFIYLFLVFETNLYSWSSVQRKCLLDLLKHVFSKRGITVMIPRTYSC